VLSCRRPRLRADLTAASTEAGVLLVGERRSVSIDSPLLSRLLPALDGRHDIAEICRAGGGLSAMPAVLGELGRLERHGLLVEGPADSGGAAAQAAADVLGLQGAGGKVEVLALSAIATSQVLDALEGAGLDARVSTLDAITAGDALLVAVVDDYLDPRLTAVNTLMLALGRPWLLTKPVGTASWVGPTFVPGVSACWSCLAERLRRNTPPRPAHGPEPVVVHLPSTTRAATGLLATEILRATARLVAARPGPPDNPAAEGAVDADDPPARLIVLDHVLPSLSTHGVARLSRCPSCAAPDPPRRRADGGGGRSAAEALAALRPAISPLPGIVTSLGAATEVIPGFAYSAFATSGVALPQGRPVPFDGAGKGRTPAAAQMSALGEALERAGGVWRPGTPTLRARWADVAEEAVWPPDLLGYSARQYARRGRGAASGAERGARVVAVPEPFDPGREIDWTWASEPVTGERVLVPTACCFYDHPDLAVRPWAYCDSNGSAAGGTWSEAVVAGFYELVERDSVALWWYNRVRRPALDLDGARNPFVDAVREHYRRLGRDLWVLDLRTDTGVVCLAAVSHRRDHPVEDVTVGFGAHLDGRAALGRAIDELNQSLPVIDQRRPDGSTVYRYADAGMLDWLQTVTTASDPYLLPDPTASPVSVDSLGSASTGRAMDDVEICARLARTVGSRLYTVDVGAEEVGLRVARVIVPGLRHFWRRLAPGRLYDTPLELGWLGRRLDETELNPRTVHL
jgi:bacteriocin biosynthesis cyclodehydratase domain-containing protein